MKSITLDFLHSPPGNRLEVLKGDRAGRLIQIRINDSTINGVFVFDGKMAMFLTLK